MALNRGWDEEGVSFKKDCGLAFPIIGLSDVRKFILDLHGYRSTLEKVIHGSQVSAGNFLSTTENDCGP